MRTLFAGASTAEVGRLERLCALDFRTPETGLGQYAFEYGKLVIRGRDPYWICHLVTLGKSPVDIVILLGGHVYDLHFHVGVDLSAEMIEGRGLVGVGDRWQSYDATPKKPVVLRADALVSHGFQPSRDTATVLVTAHTCALEMPDGNQNYHYQRRAD